MHDRWHGEQEVLDLEGGIKGSGVVKVVIGKTFCRVLSYEIVENQVVGEPVTKVAHLSGAGEYVDHVQRNFDCLDVLAEDGGSLDVLFMLHISWLLYTLERSFSFVELFSFSFDTS